MASKTTKDAADTSADGVKKLTEEPIQFEAALSELEELVTRMESGELSLDESLQAFERGVTLARQCQEQLQVAEQKVRQLTEDGDLQPFGDGDDFE